MTAGRRQSAGLTLRIRALSLFASIVLASGLLLAVTAEPAQAAWPPCGGTVQTNCVPVYPSGGVLYGATLGGASSFAVSPANCPKGSVAADNNYSCSTPVTFSIAIANDDPYVRNIHFIELQSETGPSTLYAFQNINPVPGFSGGAWCEINATTLGCVGANNTSLPMYLVVNHPVPSDTMVLCVLGQYQYGDAFAGCTQAGVTATTGPTKPKPGSMFISLSGKRAAAANSIEITMTLNNTGGSDISGLKFTDPNGLENNGVLIKNGNIGPTRSGLSLTSGPTPSLTTNLTANSQPMVVHYTYTATSPGDAVLVASASGTDAGGKTVRAKQALTIYVTNRATSEADYDKLVTSALLDADSVTDQAQNSIANAEADSLAAGLKLDTASPGQQAGAVDLGIYPQLGILVGTVKDTALAQWLGNYASTLGADLKGGATYLGQTGAAVVRELVATATDPQARAAALGRLWDGISSLPAKTQEALASQSANLGYLGDALVATTAPGGQITALQATAAAGSSAMTNLQTGVMLAANGFPAVVAADNAAYANNPSAFIKAESKQYADATYDLFKTEAATLLGDGIAKGVTSAAKAGITLATSSAKIDATVAAVVDSTAPAAPGSTAELIQNANGAISQFQTLPEGTTLAVQDASQVGGLLPGDQAGFQKSLSAVNSKFGVQLEVGARTSEPLSVGITGSPKLSFMKPKAVSAMDMLLGAPQEIAAYSAPGQAASGQVFKGGVTTVFNPVPLSAKDLAAIAETNPAFQSAYDARLASQQKLWADYQDPTSSLRVLVQGSEAAQGKGVTAISSIPGNLVPLPPPGAQPLIYLEQLDQPAFQAQFGLSPTQAQTLKSSLANSPGAVKVDYIARPNPDGRSISFFDGLVNNQPIVSDLDLQYIRPAGGAPWPPNVDPQQVLREFNVQLKQNLTRLPNHGASAIADDLPSAAIQVADGFTMSTANPVFAKGVADNLARRYASNSAIFSANAARLRSLAAVTSDPAKVKALLTQAQSYAATAAAFSKVDAAYLLAKYPPGEKIIIIKLGDVRVGYGPAAT